MNKNKILLVVFCLSLSLFLVLFSYKIVFNFSHYEAEQKEIIDFLQGKGNLTAKMTTAEATHLEEVKGVMRRMDYVFYFLLLLGSLIFTYSYKDKEQLRKLLLYGGITAFGLVLLILIFVGLDFNWLFRSFHQVFFPQGNWMFAADSYLIQTFPLDFFISITWKIIGLNLFLAVIFIWGSLYFRKG